MEETNDLHPRQINQDKYKAVPLEEEEDYKMDEDCELKEQTKNKSDIFLSVNGRWVVYSFFLAANTLISMDHGSIPASTVELRKLTSYDQGIGLFGSLVYFGNVIGSLILFKIINMFNRKLLLIISLVGNAACLFWFVFTENLLVLFLNRTLVGIFQSYITIYMPVWCKQFGKVENRTTMIAFLQLVSPIGIFLGYLIASICIREQILGGWTFAFIAQGILIGFLTLLFLFVPRRYFRDDIYSYNDRKGNEYFKASNSIKDSDEIDNPDVERENLPLCSMLKIIFRQKVFVFGVLGLSVLIYVISGVQYWISDYIMAILNVKDQKTRLFYFTLVCFTSPTLGVLLGSITKNKICQNDMTKSLVFCFVLSILAGGFAIPVPLISNINYFVGFMWLVLFFGGGIVPVITNAIVAAVPPGLDASGNSITNLVSNLGGYLPAPYVYGILSDINHDRGVIGMRVTMWYSFVGIIFYGCAMIASFKNKEPEEENPNELLSSYNLKPNI